MTIKLRRSNTSGNVPSSLDDGQIAINQADDILFSRKPDGTIRRTLLPKRYGVANAAFQIRAYDTYVGVASLSTSRVITLPAAANYPAGHLLTVADESGLVTASITVGLAVASGTSDTVNGASNLLLTTPYFGAILVSDGVSKWTALILGAGGSGSAVLYTPQTLTAAQQRQALTNLALSATNLWMTEIQAAANKGSYLGLLDGIADGFPDNSGLDLANATNVNIQNGTVVNQANDPSTKALLHFEGANASTTFTDDAGHTFTVNGGAQISTSQSVFGSASGAFLTSTSYIIGTSNDFIVGAGDFSYELRIRPTSVADSTSFLDTRTSGGTGGISLQVNGSKFCVIDNGTTVITGTTTVSVNTWYAVQIARAGGTLRLFVNGAIDGSAANTTNFSNNQIKIGARSDGVNAASYIDEFRLSVIARNTSAYTPAISAFSYGSSGVLTMPSINYGLQSVPTKGSIRIRARATADAIAPNTNFIASLSRNGGANSLDVILAATAVLPDGFTHYEANEVDLTGLPAGQTLKGALRTVGTTLGVAIDGWRIRAA